MAHEAKGWIELLQKPCGKNVIPQDEVLLERLGLDVSQTIAFNNAVFGDLDVKRGGIGWWPHALGDARRRLIADYFLQAGQSLARGALEMAVHRRRAEDAWHDHERILTKAAPPVGAPPRVFARSPYASPADRLADIETELHIVGFARSAGTILDCLAVQVATVAALPVELKMVTHARVRDELTKAAQRQGRAARFRRQLLEAIDEAEAASGAHGWLEWILQLRHMLVHRTRRSSFVAVQHRPGYLFKANGTRPQSATAHLALPLQPDLSDVEAWQLVGFSFNLSEDARVTLEQTELALVSYMERVAAALMTAWKARRSSRGLVAQPKVQWYLPIDVVDTGFAGFSPGSLDSSFAFGEFHLWAKRRWEAASIPDQQRHRWKRWLQRSRKGNARRKRRLALP